MKWLIWLVGLWLALLMAVFVLAVVKGGPTSPNPVHGYPAAVVAADWAMTQQMATSEGPAMDAQMQSYGMLQRSQDPNYVAALEAYGHQIDKDVGALALRIPGGPRWTTQPGTTASRYRSSSSRR